jgi:hypothetical protein
MYEYSEPSKGFPIVDLSLSEEGDDMGVQILPWMRPLLTSFSVTSTKVF